MKILGIEIKHPSLGELALAAIFIFAISGFELILDNYNLIPSGNGWPIVVAASVGVMLNAFGVSISTHGWRAIVLMLAAGSLVWLFFLA